MRPDEVEGTLAMIARKTLSNTQLTSVGPDGADGMRPSSVPEAFDEAAKGQVYRQWCRGVSVAILSRKHGRSSSAIDRVIDETRARRILGQTLEYTHEA